MLLYISNLADVAKRPNAPDCDSGIRGFETLHPPHYLKLSRFISTFLFISKRKAMRFIAYFSFFIVFALDDVTNHLGANFDATKVNLFLNPTTANDFPFKDFL